MTSRRPERSERRPGPQRRESFSYFAGQSRVGGAAVCYSGDVIELDYGVLDNGRGERLHERICVSADWLPLAWQISGTSLLGGRADEELATDSRQQTWRSQADRGHRDRTGRPLLYVATEACPFASWLYVRAALAAGGEVDAIPSGTVRAKVLCPDLADAPGPGPLTAIALSGVTLVPQYVLLDAEQALVAVLGGNQAPGEMLLRDDYRESVAAIAELGRTIARDHLRRVAARLTHRWAAPVRFSDVRVFDPATRSLSEPVSVTIIRGQITVVEPESAVVPVEGEVLIGGAGGTLLAGLHDMHTHLDGWSGLLCIAAGVTTVRDMGNDNVTLGELLSELSAGDVIGPAVVPSGLVEGSGEFALQAGVVAGSIERALEAVRWYAANGYHQIKIYNSVHPDWVAPMARLAHQLGLRVAGHIPAFTTPDRMIEDGYDEITHVNQLVLGWLLGGEEDTRTALRITAMARAKDLDLASATVNRTVELMAHRDIALDTTVAVLEQLMLSRAGTVMAGDAPYLGHTPMSYQRLRKSTNVPYADASELGDYDESFGTLLDVLRLLHGRGIRLWPGTDDGTGFTLHRELELYVEAGLRPADVLTIATLDCARHLGRGHAHGSVERGKAASFALLDGDPTEDISAIRRIRAVVKDGDVYFPSELYAELGITPFTRPPSVRPGISGRGTTTKEA